MTNRFPWSTSPTMSSNTAGTPVQGKWKYFQHCQKRISWRSLASGDIIREHSALHQNPSYMAHKAYLASTSWDTGNEFRVKTLFTGDGLSPLFSVLTGKVSRSNLHLSTTGDCKLVGDPRQLPFPILNACLRFSLEEPLCSSHAAFGEDFKKIVDVTLDAVDSMPGIGKKGLVSPFLTRSEDGQWRFNLEFKIFDKKVFAHHSFKSTLSILWQSLLTFFPIQHTHSGSLRDASRLHASDFCLLSKFPTPWTSWPRRLRYTSRLSTFHWTIQIRLLRQTSPSLGLHWRRCPTRRLWKLHERCLGKNPHQVDPRQGSGFDCWGYVHLYHGMTNCSG